ncbi:MAG: BON domain-containing protein [Bdellovibrionaceae bacterium]|nr:BON domain-containing protein [Pseudobdellovibrionaceae bacterium]
MHNKKHGSDHDTRRSSNQRNYAMEDNKKRFQDQDYDRYFPEQNSYHGGGEDAHSQSQYGYGQRGPSYEQGSSYGQGSQSWSQPVRNDEVSQSGRSYFGKGPKGFKRSDDRICEEVSEALFHDHAVDASEIEVAVHDGEVTLTGTVAERRMKRLAEDCVDKVTGVTDVKNEIRIQASSFADRSEKTGSLPNTDDSMSSDRSSTSPSGISKSKGPNKLM